MAYFPLVSYFQMVDGGAVLFAAASIAPAGAAVAAAEIDGVTDAAEMNVVAAEMNVLAAEMNVAAAAGFENLSEAVGIAALLHEHA
ncbi:hypothetical protein LIER_19219 [Lithospermum erythrorhizon]|uniref:Uncharacterized protein n=1 Tax=Lithospermum erythrorhizon TaxID=34254 RepID=A0AAV3QL96_LITER